MKKKATLKKIVLFCIIAAVLVFAVGSIIGSDKPIFTQEESLEDWAVQFEDATAPEGYELYRKGYGIGIGDNGAKGKAYYGYYWIIKNINTDQDDIFGYYHSFAARAGIDTMFSQGPFGYDEDGNVAYPIFPIETVYKIDGLDEALSSLKQEDLLGNDYYIIYVIRPGS